MAKTLPKIFTPRNIILFLLSLILTRLSWGEAPPKPQAKSYSVQIGAFTSLRKAAVIRSILQSLAETRVEKIKSDREESIYRVLVGTFENAEDAEKFAKTNQLGKLFKGAWIHPVVTTDANESTKTEILSPEALAKDPYFIHLDLHCEEGKKYGIYRTELQPDEKDSQRNVDLNVQWNCIPNPKERWIAKDEQRSPSHFSFTPLLGVGSLGATDAAFGSINRTDLSYGIEATAFKNFGGMGPVFEYRLLNHRLTGEAALAPSPLFVLNHRALIGVRLPISHRFEFQPFFGFSNSFFFQGTSAADIAIQTYFLPQLGGRFTWHALELVDRTWFNISFGYHYLLSSTKDTTAFLAGSEWSLKFQARHFFPSGWGVDWFFEYGSHSQGTSSLQQSNQLVLLGVSLLGPL